MLTRPRAIRAFGGLVVLIGLVVFARLEAGPWYQLVMDAPVQFGLLAALVFLGELNPVSLMRRGTKDETSPSTTFSFAILLSMGSGPAIATLVLAGLVADIRKQRSRPRLLLNVAHSTLALAAAGGVLAAFGDQAPMADLHIGLSDVVPLALATMAFFFVNNTFTAVFAALTEGLSVRRQLTEELRFQASTTGVLLGLSPVAVLVAQSSPLLLPFLLLPAAAVYTSARNAMEKERQSLHDALTGLPNRAYFRREVRRAIENGVAGDEHLAVMLMDLDRFKEVNDTLGHHTGDELLIQVGPRLTDPAHGLLSVARLGGDEFALLCKVPNTLAAAEIAKGLVKSVEVPFIVDDLKLELEASIGIAMYPSDGDEVDSLLQRADVAMYLAKEAHSGFEVYTSDRDKNSRAKLQLLGELREAIANRQLVLFYQPQADLRTGRVTSVEALVRWHHPEHGLVPPSEFVPIAEHSGLIEPLTQCVLEEAVAQCSLWCLAGKPLRVAVNLSARSLHDLSLPRQISELLKKWDVAPDLLALEITESTIMADPVRALKVMTALANMGIRLAIDDFGTGYSSLAYLRQLPVSEIKIDKSFVSNMAKSENDAIIVRSTVELARNLGMEVAAEGVESEEVWEMLANLGCHLAQGYHLSRALAAEHLEPWLFDQARELFLADVAAQLDGPGSSEPAGSTPSSFSQ